MCMNTYRSVSQEERDMLKAEISSLIDKEIAAMCWYRRLWHRLFPSWFCKHTIQDDERTWCQLVKDRSSRS